MTAPHTLDSEAVSVSVEPFKGGNRVELSEVVVVDEILVKLYIILEAPVNCKRRLFAGCRSDTR